MFFGGKFPKSQTKRRQVSRMMRSIAFSDAGSRWEEETLRYFHRNNERERSSFPRDDQKPKEKKRKERENEKSLRTSGTVDEHLNRPSRPEIGSHDVLQTFRGVDVHEQSRGFIHAFGVWVHRTERGGHFDGKFWSVVGVGVVSKCRGVLLKIVRRRLRSAKC